MSENKDVGFEIKCESSKEAFELLHKLLKKGKTNFTVCSEFTLFEKGEVVKELLNKKERKK